MRQIMVLGLEFRELQDGPELPLLVWGEFLLHPTRTTGGSP